MNVTTHLSHSSFPATDRTHTSQRANQPLSKESKKFTLRNVTLGLVGAAGVAALFYALKEGTASLSSSQTFPSKLSVPEKSLEFDFVRAKCGLQPDTCKREANRFLNVEAIAEKKFVAMWKILQEGDWIDLRDRFWIADNGLTDYYFDLDRFYFSDEQSKFTDKLIQNTIQSFDKSSISAVMALSKLGWLNDSYRNLTKIQTEHASYLAGQIELVSVEHMEKLESLWKNAPALHTEDQKSAIRTQFLNGLVQKSKEGSTSHMETLHSLWKSNLAPHTEDEKQEIRKQFFQALYETVQKNHDSWLALKKLLDENKIQELGGDVKEARAAYFEFVRKLAVIGGQQFHFDQYLEAIEKGLIAVSTDERTKFIQEYQNKLIKLIEEQKAYQGILDNLLALSSRGLAPPLSYSDRKRLQDIVSHKMRMDRISSGFG